MACAVLWMTVRPGGKPGCGGGRPSSVNRAADSRATTAWVSVQPLRGSAGSRRRTWLLANVTSDGRRPGSDGPASSRMAVARVSPAPKRTTSQPSSREIEATPAASAVRRSSATSMSRMTGSGIGP